MPSEWVDFKKIKEAVAIEVVMKHYGVQLRRVNAFSLRGMCPLPAHTSKTSPSLCVNTEKNIWACQSDSCVKARSGKKGGNVLDFVAAMESCSIRDAALKIADWFSVPPESGGVSSKATFQSNDSKQLVAEKKTEGEVTNTNESGQNKPLGFVLKNIDHCHPYLIARGITPETAAYFGAGFFSGKGSMSNRIVIGIHNAQGELVAYAGRSIDNAEPRYKFPSGFHKSELWNVHRVLALDQAARVRRVIIVEGFFDAMKIHEAGYPHVVSLMGSAMSCEQEDILATNFKGIVLALDGDEAGRRAAQEIALRLTRRAFVRVAPIPEGKQPDELPTDELRKIFGSL